MEKKGWLNSLFSSEREKKQESQNQVEMKPKTSLEADFLIKVSQEIRFSLNSIMGFNDLILGKKDLNEEIFENSTKIHNSGVALLGVINNILDFARMKSGNLELIPVDYEISSLIRNVISLNMANAEVKPIKFNLNLDANLPSRLIGDELRLRQAFNNMLSNAFKYTKTGTIEWSVGFEYAGKDFWLVSKIKDSGAGIKEEDMKDLFSKYNQPGARIEGMGLGLAIAKEIIDMMGGVIEVESKHGKGTIFTVKVKQQVQNKTPLDEKVISNLKNFYIQSNKTEKKLKLVYEQMPSARILVVDDMSLNLEVAKGLMRPYGMQIDTAPSGKIALAKVINQSTRYSAIFMDYMMPEMNGVETVRKIRALDSDYAKNIPIIALTANAEAGGEKIFLESGFNDFIGKPIDIIKLDAVLKKWIKTDEA
ncbi:MAG: ATP-binding protein [Fibromonadales bacterium]|nr:ATP-binding protein [Fibromonadales bacterium]